MSESSILTYQGTDGREGKLTFYNDDRLAETLRFLNGFFRQGRGVWFQTSSDESGDLDRLIFFPPTTLLQAQFQSEPYDLQEELN